jgi:hypothetical protein
MLPFLSIQSPLVDVRWRLTTGEPGAASFSAVQHSAWRASDGTVGVVVTNISDDSVHLRIPIQLKALGLSSNVRYTVRLLDGTQTSVVSANVVGDTIPEIDVPPLKVLLVTITPS